MANTTNLNLVKLSGTEKLKNFPSIQAGNADIVDSALGAGFGISGKPNVNASISNLADGIAIISNNNTHAAITNGQFVYVRNHGNLSEGLYTATANISANGTLSGSNLTANNGGGLNALSSEMKNKISDKSAAYVSSIQINNLNSTEDYVMFGNGTESGWSANVGSIIYDNEARQFKFREKGTVNSSNYDQFYLPEASDSTSNHSYKILTSKDFPLAREIGVSPGGTSSGDGNNKITFTAPGANRHCLICFAAEFTNIFCSSASGSTVYSGTIPTGWSLTKNNLVYTLTRTATQAFRYTLLWM